MFNFNLSQINLSVLASLALVVPSGTTAVYMANQPNLTDAEVQILGSSLQICCASSTPLFSLLDANRKKAEKK